MRNLGVTHCYLPDGSRLGSFVRRSGRTNAKMCNLVLEAIDWGSGAIVSVGSLGLGLSKLSTGEISGQYLRNAGGRPFQWNEYVAMRCP